MNKQPQNKQCCPEFDPTVWDGKNYVAIIAEVK